MGSAIIPFDLDNAAYAQTAADQFSAVTPGNEMKWQVVEPTQGVFDWSGGDRLVQDEHLHRSAPQFPVHGPGLVLLFKRTRGRCF